MTTNEELAALRTRVNETLNEARTARDTSNTTQLFATSVMGDVERLRQMTQHDHSRVGDVVASLEQLADVLGTATTHTPDPIPGPDPDPDPGPGPVPGPYHIRRAVEPQPLAGSRVHDFNGGGNTGFQDLLRQVGDGDVVRVLHNPGEPLRVHNHNHFTPGRYPWLWFPPDVTLEHPASKSSGYAAVDLNNSRVNVAGLTVHKGLYALMIAGCQGTPDHPLMFRSITGRDTQEAKIAVRYNHVEKVSAHIDMSDVIVSGHDGTPERFTSEGIYLNSWPARSGAKVDRSHHITIRRVYGHDMASEIIDAKQGGHHIVIEYVTGDNIDTESDRNGPTGAISFGVEGSRGSEVFYDSGSVDSVLQHIRLRAIRTHRHGVITWGCAGLEMRDVRVDDHDNSPAVRRWSRRKATPNNVTPAATTLDGLRCSHDGPVLASIEGNPPRFVQADVQANLGTVDW